MAGSLALRPGRVLAQVTDTVSARAEALFAAKDYVGAASAYQALTRTHPQQPRYWTRLGTSLQMAGRPDDAVAAYRKAIGITTAPIAMYNLAAVFAKRGQKDSAFYWLDQLVSNASYSNDKAVSADEDFASLRSDPRFEPLLERMRAVLRLCLTRDESRRFDFWVGEWEVKNAQGQPAGQSSVQRLLEGCALYENWTDLQGGGGKSLNSYNTDVKQWQQFWTDQYGRVTEYRESEWLDGSLRFTAKQIMPQGPALLHMTFTPVKPDVVRQFGEMSVDGGKTWTPTFDLYYYRKK
ncbi:MAG TPA: tetratricopeptide repeat protein [Gemmatimonadaceae bacterium]|nr:tetratricopeptide repeat protein [Gemmatimonadaceae bacterium]